MNAERLLQHYERIADAPDVIVRLRRFILDLAVHGKLVPQDANDEPASELLKRVAREKARLVKAGEIREKPSLPAVANADMPFPIPSEWEWVRFANIVDFSAGRTPSRNDTSFWNNGDHAWVSIADMEDGQVLTATKETVSDKARERVFGSEPEAPGTILMSFKLTIGKIARLGMPAFHNEAIISIRPHLAELDPYLFKILSQFARQGDTKGAIKGATLNRDSISNILFPLPPLAEQRRIVAKIDELMGLCDRLEAARAGREATRDRLASASLARLNAPDPETFQDDARFALDALPALTARADQIKRLRQIVLNLAVRGKLVPQDANDEPARLKATDCDAPPKDIPSSWLYTRLSNLLAEDTRNGYSRKPDEAPDGIPILRISAGTVRRDGVVAEEEHKLISGIDDEARIQYGLKSGDLLACRFNGNRDFVGRLTIFRDYLGLQPIYPDKLIRVRVSPELSTPEFVRLAGDTDLVRAEVEAACATTVGNWGISAGNLKEVQIPLPPLAEQHRIVAKVDELMGLCDRLEASLTATAATRRRLLDALLAEALTPIDARKLEAAE
jgi:type I restriction enzyme S subunit